MEAELTRYEFDQGYGCCGGGGIVKAADGDFVRYDDHKAALEAHRRLIRAMLAVTQHDEACECRRYGGQCAALNALLDEEVAALAALPVAAQIVQVVERDRLRDAIAGALGDAYDCTRVWSAWSYGTMSQDDFVQVAEQDERLDEIVDAVVAAITTARTTGGA